MAVDGQDGTIEMQHFDGTLEESEPDDWIEMHAEKAEAPEDWSGSVDVSREDLPGGNRRRRIDWQAQVDQLEDFD